MDDFFPTFKGLLLSQLQFYNPGDDANIGTRILYKATYGSVEVAKEPEELVALADRIKDIGELGRIMAHCITEDLELYGF